MLPIRPRALLLLTATQALLLAGCFTMVYGPGARPADTSNQPEAPALDWIIDADHATQLIEASPAPTVLLDARTLDAFDAEHIEGSTHVTWQEFSRQDDPYRGQLLPDIDALASRIGAVGAHPTRNVLVIGEPLDGWGEEGRIVWMLRAMGIQSAAVVDGGYSALVARTTTSPTAPLEQSPVAFDPAPTEELTANTEEILALLAQPDVTLIDTREEREYNGETPYGERRPGHLPGAVHVYFKDLLDDDGLLRPEAELRAIFEERGITPEAQAIAYCTGGIRSAWFVVVLRHLGYDRARNYPGSMWEWAAQPEETHPLE